MLDTSIIANNAVKNQAYISQMQNETSGFASHLGCGQFRRQSYIAVDGIKNNLQTGIQEGSKVSPDVFEKFLENKKYKFCNCELIELFAKDKSYKNFLISKFKLPEVLPKKVFIEIKEHIEDEIVRRDSEKSPLVKLVKFLKDKKASKQTIARVVLADDELLQETFNSFRKLGFKP